MHSKDLEPRLKRLYYVVFFGVIILGLALLGFQYFYWLLKGDLRKDIREFASFSGYSVVLAGVLVCILIALLRWRTAEVDDGRRPNFTAGVAILVVGAVLMIASLLAVH